MDDNLRVDIIERLSKTFGEVAARRGVFIDAPIRSFVKDVVLESLEVREREWRRRDFDPDRPESSIRIIGHVDEVVRSLAQDAETYKSESGVEHILLIGVVEQVHKKWCGIFPFCR